MKSLIVCKRQNALLSVGLAVLACGVMAFPVMAQTASITFLNDFTNSSYYEFWLNGMSDDASVIVGNIGIQDNDGRVVNQAFRWTADTGIVFLTPPPGYGPGGTVNDVSADGTKMLVTFGSSVVYGGGRFYWTAAEGFVDIGSDLPGDIGYASTVALSADGSTIVGWSRPAPNTTEAFSRVGDGTVFSLGDLPGGSFQSQAFDVSGDGSVVVGNGTIDWYGYDFLRATRWTMDSSGNSYTIEVPDFASVEVCDWGSRTWAVSADGTTAVGEVTTVDGTEVFRWMADGGVDFPFRSAGKSASYVRLMSPDGSLIYSAPGLWGEATNSIVSLGDIQDTLVNDFGVDMGGWDITTTGSALEAISVTPQGINLLGRIQFSIPGSPTGARNDGLPYIIRLPYLPIGGAPEPHCSTTWESSAVGDPGLSVQPPWEGVDFNAFESVADLAVFDDGNGSALYASGRFIYAGGNNIGAGIAKWDGQSWSALGKGLRGTADPVGLTLTVFDDGTGPALYVTGNFLIAGDVLAENFAKWDGQQWSAVGWAPTSAHFAMQALDDGSGPVLYAQLPIVGNGSIVKWDGSQWLSVGTSGLDNCQSGALEFFDDGTGPVLYGLFSGTGCFGSTDSSYEKNQVAKLDGTQWVSVAVLDGPGLNTDLISWDDGSGSALYVLGWNILSVNGDSDISGLVRWDGLNWSTTKPTSATDYGYTKANIIDDGNGPALVVSGAGSLMKWDGQDWFDVAPFGCGTAPQGTVSAIVEYDDGQGRGIYLGGDFLFAGPEFARNIAMLRSCTIPRPGDCNADGVVDMVDFGFFSGCLSGPGNGTGVGCECSDVDGDGDVDLGDFAAFMEGFTG